MQLIAVIADTHIPSRAKELPAQLLQELGQHSPAKILHAGDVVEREVLDELEQVAPVQAVKGNNDHFSLPAEHAETVEDVTIAMRHRKGNVEGFADQTEADIVIYGHTHAKKVDEVGDVKTLNPGSPTVPRGVPSYAIIEVDGAASAVSLKQVGEPDM